MILYGAYEERERCVMTRVQPPLGFLRKGLFTMPHPFLLPLLPSPMILVKLIIVNITGLHIAIRFGALTPGRECGYEAMD